MTLLRQRYEVWKRKLTDASPLQLVASHYLRKTMPVEMLRGVIEQVTPEMDFSLSPPVTRESIASFSFTLSPTVFGWKFDGAVGMKLSGPQSNREDRI